MFNKEQLQSFKNRLLEEQGEVEHEIRESEAPAEMGDDVESDWSEEASEAEETSKNLGVKDSLKRRLGDINTALGKIDKGTFGVCEECGKEIEREVLEVVPESRYCKACKAAAL